MAKILLFTDNHFCEMSSIVRKYGAKYSVRLENQIQSLNWLEDLAIEKNCGAVFCLGDFFNTPNLTSNEITALKDIKWNNLPHYFLVGNHESEDTDLHCNSTKALESEKHFIISNSSAIQLGSTQICFLPYILESDRKPIVEYFGKIQANCKRIILSHNDLKGIQLGPVLTQSGFELADIEANSDLFINGHLHNGTAITKKIINLGNLTGQDFKESADIYKHNVIILDTDSLHFEYIENPFAFNFYKVDINSKQDLDKLSKMVKQNSVLSIKCPASLTEVVKSTVKSLPIVESRIMISQESSTTESDITELGIDDDYLNKFIAFCKEKLDTSDILNFELAEICK